MTEPSQYFKGRTVQEQMNEVIGYVDTRAAEVATTAIAADVAQVHQDMLDADADASAAAASAAAAAGTLANTVKKTGEASQSIAGDIAVSGDLSAGDLAVTGDAGVQGQLNVLGDCNFNNEVKVRTPVNNTDAANKKYVDDADALKANKTYVDTQDALKLSIGDVNTVAVGLTGNQYDISGYKKFLNEPFGYNISSEIKQFDEQTAFLDLSSDGAYTKAFIFEFTESNGIGRAICKFTVSPNGVIAEDHNVVIGTMSSIIGVVRYNGMVYLTLSGQGVFSNMYIRAGGTRRRNPVEIETPFSVADTVTYPDQLVIAW